MKNQLSTEYELKCDDLNVDLSPHSPQRALRSAGGEEGVKRDSVNGLVGRKGPGATWGDQQGGRGLLSVTLKVPFRTVFMMPGLNCGDTNRARGER